jgi:hypothetical protein
VGGRCIAYFRHVLAGVASTAAPSETRGIFNALMSFSALTLGVTLSALTLTLAVWLLTKGVAPAPVQARA